MTTRATAEPKETVTYESREAIMGCGCRIVMDAATFDSEGAHCAVARQHRGRARHQDAAGRD